MFRTAVVVVVVDDARTYACTRDGAQKNEGATNRERERERSK